MINLSQLLFPDTAYHGGQGEGDGRPGARRGPTGPGGPAVLWEAPGELSPAESRTFIDDLARVSVPILMFAGADLAGHPEILDLAEYAASRGLRISFMLGRHPVTPDQARRIKAAGAAWVSLEIEGANLETVCRCHAGGLKVSLGIQLTRAAAERLPALLDLVLRESADRLVIYHRVYQTSEGAADDPTPAGNRAVMDWLIDRAILLRVQGHPIEFLTADNDADAVYAYLHTRRRDADRAARMWQLLSHRQGNQSGVGTAAVSASGLVLPDVHTPGHPLGNVRTRPFSEIWSEAGNPIHLGLRNRKMLLNGRCADCRWLPICNGNSRTRAEAVSGDFWGADPQCYLTEAEIGLESQ